MHPSSEPGADPGFYSRVVRRGWRPLVAFTILGAGVGLLLGAVLPRTYAATAVVLVTTTGVPETSAVGERTIGGDVNLDTEAQLLRSTDVVARVVERTGGDFDPETVSNHVSVDVPANTTVLDITFTAATPELAREGARAFAEAYLANRREQAQETMAVTSDGYRRELDAALRQQSALRAQADRTPQGAEDADLQARMQGVAARVAALTQTLVSLDSPVVTPGRLLNEPRLPRHHTSPHRRLLALSGAALGFLAGLAVAVRRERVRPRVRSEEDVRRELQLPVLARLRTSAGPVRVIPAPQSGQELEFARLYRRVQHEGHDPERVLVMAVSSAAAGLHTGVNLAWQYGRRGVRSCLVVPKGQVPPGVPVRPLPGEPGVELGALPWTGDLATTAPVGVMSVDRFSEGTCSVPAGPGSVVVVHPGTEPAMAELLTEPGDPVVLLVEQGRDRAPECREAVLRLEECGLVVLGVVLHPGYPDPARWGTPTTHPPQPAPDDGAAPPPLPTGSGGRTESATPPTLIGAGTSRSEPVARLAVRRLRAAARRPHLRRHRSWRRPPSAYRPDPTDPDSRPLSA